jgi:hypothetical protein
MRKGPGFVREANSGPERLEQREGRNKLGSRLGGLGNPLTILISQAVVPAKSPTRSEYPRRHVLLSQWTAGVNFFGTRVLVPVQIWQVKKFKVRLKKHSR